MDKLIAEDFEKKGFMIKRFFIFSSLFVFLVSTSFSEEKTFISLIYGYTPLSLNDFNDHTNSLNNMFSLIYDRFPSIGPPIFKSKEFEGLEHASSFESEIRIEIKNRFEIGFLFSYFLTHKSSESFVTAGSYEIFGQLSTKMTLLNPNLVLFHYIPFTKWFYVELSMGLGYYYAKVPFNQFLSIDHPYLFEQNDYFYQQSLNTNLRSHGFGALAGLTFEIRPLKFLGILLGARYRFVQMGKLSGSGIYEDTNTPQTEIDSGVLYYYYDQDLQSEFGEKFSQLIFSADLPQGFFGLRQVKLDLTGYTLIIGLRFWF